MSLRFLTLLLLLPLLTCGQTNRVVRGRVVEQGTGQPLPFVTLSVADGQLSSASNADGQFMLSLPDSYATDSLMLTTLDYHPKRLPLASLTSSGTVIELAAAPSATPSTDTYFDTALPFATRDTLLKVVAAIGRNYSQQPTLLHGFYRETVRNQTSDVPTMEAEGLIDVYKPSYRFPEQNDRIRFLKGRHKPHKQSTTPILTPGPWVSNMLDVVKYQDFLFRNRTVNKNYEFARTGNAVLGGQPVYVIRFRPRDDAQLDGYFTGNLYVTAGSLAIVRADYTLTPAGLKLLNQAPGYVQLYKAQLLRRTYVARYTRFGRAWSFQGGSVENILAHDFSPDTLKARIDFVVTRRDDNGVKPISHFAEASMRLPMQPFDTTNDSFWQGETYLLPNRP